MFHYLDQQIFEWKFTDHSSLGNDDNDDECVSDYSDEKHEGENEDKYFLKGIWPQIVSEISSLKKVVSKEYKIPYSK